MCKFYRKNGYKCKARLKVNRPANSDIIIAEEADIQHDHEPKQPLVGPMKLTEATKAIIRQECFQNGRKPQQIRNILQDVCYLNILKIYFEQFSEIDHANIPSLSCILFQKPW
jgi:hypothetical protein